jgi:hypothetical protein
LVAESTADSSGEHRINQRPNEKPADNHATRVTVATNAGILAPTVRDVIA